MRKLLLLLALILSVQVAYGQGYDERNIALNGAGQPLAGVSIAVCAPVETTAANVTNNIATLTIGGTSPATQGFAVGGTLTVAGFTSGDTVFNGTFTVLGLTSTQIIYVLQTGNLTAGTNGTVLQEGTTVTMSCGGLLPIFTDYSMVTPEANPLVTDGLGNYSFTVAPGIIYVQRYGPSVQTTFVQETPPCVVDSSCGGGGGGPITFNAPTGFQVTGSPGSTITLGMPMGWTAADLLIGNGADSVARLGIGTSGQILTVSGGLPAWVSPGINDVVCQLNYGDQSSGVPLTTGNIQPQSSQCNIPQSGTMNSVVVMVDSGASTVQLGYRHSGSTTAITGVLTPSAVGGITSPVVCANAGGTSQIIEGVSVTCGTLSNTAVTAGDYFETIGGAADGTSESMSIALIFTQPGGGGGGGGSGGLADPGSNGIVVRNALNVTQADTITAGTNMSVANGDGVAGNPTISAGANLADKTAANSWTLLQTFLSGLKVSANQPMGCVEGTAPSTVSGQDILYCDSSTHSMLLSNDGGGFGQVRTGTVGVVNGGTSLTSVAAGDLLCGAGTSPFSLVTPGTAAQVLTSNGAGACPSFQNGPTGMSASLDTITAAVADATIGNGAFQERWNSTQTGSQTAMYFGEAVAATGSSNIKVRVSTLSTSTAFPVQFDNNGNGVRMSATGVLGPLGTGGYSWSGLLSIPTVCTNQFVKAPTASTLGCASVNLTSDVTGTLPYANGGTNATAAPIKRELFRMGGCNAGTSSPGLDIPIGVGMGYNCKTDGTHGTVQGVLSAADGNIAYINIAVPPDFVSFNNAIAQFTTSDNTVGHTIILNIATACAIPNTGVTDTPAYNSPNAFTTVTIGGGATANALYSTTAGTITATGCPANAMLHIAFSRATDTSTDTGIQIESLIVSYNGSYQ